MSSRATPEPGPRTPPPSRVGSATLRVAACVGGLLALASAVNAQNLDPWGAGVEVQKASPGAPKAGTTTIERSGETKSSAAPGVKLVALLTADGQQIDQGIVWRIYKHDGAPGKSKLVSEDRQASPLLKLQPGDYMVNVAFGRANLTKKVVVDDTAPQTVQFVLNAGGLRMNALVGGKPAAVGAVTYTIYSDDRDQFANRTPVLSSAKPNLIIRLNAGIYRIVSTYGDANARVETDVTVEAGKLTEATVAHSAGRAMFKLVTRSGGEAIPDTTWTIQAANGEIVKESVGALPSHYLAPGAYAIAARSGGQIYAGQFAIKDGDSTVVEVLKDGGVAVEPAAAPQPDVEPAAAPSPAPATEPPSFNIEPAFSIKSP